MAKAKAKNAKACAWRGCNAKPTRVLTWPSSDAEIEDWVKQDFCDFHANAALFWAGKINGQGADAPENTEDGNEVGA